MAGVLLGDTRDGVLALAATSEDPLAPFSISL